MNRLALIFVLVLLPQFGGPRANDAVVGDGVRRVARMVRFSSILSAHGAP